MTRRFAYRAYTADGRLTSGTLAADNEGQALHQLTRSGLLPFETRAAAGSDGRASRASSRGMSATELNHMVRGVVTLIDAGVPIDAALRLTAAQATTPRRSAALLRLHEDVVAGRPLSEAMARQPEIFSPGHVAVAQAGEATGSLGAALRDLCAGLERDAELTERLRSAFLYPGILLAVAFLAVVLILMIMTPAIAPLFDGQSKPLPFILAAARRVGRLLSAYWIGFAAVLAAATLGLGAALRTAGFRRRMLTVLTGAPLVRTLARDAAAARFARTLAILLRGGAGLPRALSVTAGAMRNGGDRAALDAALDAVKRGVSLAESLSGFRPLSSTSRGLLQIGEESNRVTDMLTRIAEMHEADLDRGIDRLMTLLTPLLTVIIGLVVGGIILSVMNAVLSANDLAF